MTLTNRAKPYSFSLPWTDDKIRALDDAIAILFQNKTPIPTANLSGFVDLTTQVTGVLPVLMGGTGTSTKFTPGSVVFAGVGGVYTQDNTNFLWDNVSKQLQPAQLKMPAQASGPFNGAGFAGIAYRVTGESWADPALIFRSNGYAFENITPAWLAILHNDVGGNDGNLGIGIRSTDTPAKASTRLHIRRGGIRIDTDTSGVDYGGISMSGTSLSLTSTANSGVGAITLAGVLLDSSFGSHAFAAAGTGANLLSVSNPLAGVGNYAEIAIGTDTITNFHLQGFSSTYTPTGYIFANGSAVVTSGVGGLSFVNSSTGDIRFYTTGAITLRMKIATGGLVSTTGQMTVNGATTNIGGLTVLSTGTGDRTGITLFSAANTPNDAYCQLDYTGTVFELRATYLNAEGYKPITISTHDLERIRFFTSGGISIGNTVDPGLANLSLTGRLTTYNNVVTAGWGVPAIYGYGRPAAGQTGAVASVATYTVGAADGSFLISANVNVTVSTLHNFLVTCNYTDETNTARILNMSFSQITGAIVTAITNATGTGAYEGVVLRIRCKASTAITFSTTGTFTTVTYNVEADATQVA